MSYGARNIHEGLQGAHLRGNSLAEETAGGKVPYLPRAPRGRGRSDLPGRSTSGLAAPGNRIFCPVSIRSTALKAAKGRGWCRRKPGPGRTRPSGWRSCATWAGAAPTTAVPGGSWGGSNPGAARVGREPRDWHSGRPATPGQPEHLSPGWGLRCVRVREGRKEEGDVAPALLIPKRRVWRAAAGL